MEVHLFAEVGDLLRSMAPEGLGELRFRSHRRGIKVWFGPETPPKEHYEAQFIPIRYVQGADSESSAVEIGFHAEHSDESKNEASLTRLIESKKVWTTELAGEVVGGAFLGRDSWRRLSEVWVDVDTEDPDLAFEIAGRLVDFLELIEPVRQGGG